jgi:hypothetical protein
MTKKTLIACLIAAVAGVATVGAQAAGGHGGGGGGGHPAAAGAAARRRLGRRHGGSWAAWWLGSGGWHGGHSHGFTSVYWGWGLGWPVLVGTVLLLRLSLFVFYPAPAYYGGRRTTIRRTATSSREAPRPRRRHRNRSTTVPTAVITRQCKPARADGFVSCRGTRHHAEAPRSRIPIGSASDAHEPVESPIRRPTPRLRVRAFVARCAAAIGREAREAFGRGVEPTIALVDQSVSHT